jgi:DNA invertase Pin-like site-specific DNA recombinase
MRSIRCAIYTRKSSDDGLEQAFNSLHAQREACAAFITSQKAEGWVLVPTAYDDGGLSGGTLDRPAMQRLLADIDAGLVDQVVVYKIDRLTRSLADFAKIVERLDGAGASFVSVTQSFNTATSMGRLTLNMLLSFAQFEREVTAERIRDKIAASKRKGLWMGGFVPLGYMADGRTLRIHDEEAQTVRRLYELYLDLGTVRAVTEAAAGEGLRSKVRELASGRMQGGTSLGRGHVHHILTNPLYAGRIRHRRAVHDGQHPAIIAPEVWEEVQARLMAEAAKPRRPTGSAPGQAASLLADKIHDETGDRLTPTHSKTRAGARLCYYVSSRLVRISGEPGIGGWRLPAADLETKVAEVVALRLSTPATAGTLLAAPTVDQIAAVSCRLEAIAAGATENEGPHALLDLVARVDVAPGELTINLPVERIATALDVAPDGIAPAALTIRLPFQTRKRGVETRLVLGSSPAPAKIDRTLLANIARARHWFRRLTSGESYAAIAESDGTSKDRVQKLIDLALLSPKIVEQVIAGTQPPGLTTEYLIRNPLPADWAEQERLVARLG